MVYINSVIEILQLTGLIQLIMRNFLSKDRERLAQQMNQHNDGLHYKCLITRKNDLHEEAEDNCYDRYQLLNIPVYVVRNNKVEKYLTYEFNIDIEDLEDYEISYHKSIITSKKI